MFLLLYGSCLVYNLNSRGLLFLTSLMNEFVFYRIVDNSPILIVKNWSCFYKCVVSMKILLEIWLSDANDINEIELTLIFV